MTITLCGPDHAPLIAAIGRETYKDTYQHLTSHEVMVSYLEDSFSVDGIRNGLADPESLTFLITEEGNSAAFLKINFAPSQTDFNLEDSMELQRIYVRNEYKKRGYGKILIEKAVSEARKRACSSIWLSVWQKNLEAIQFYEKMGFSVSGTRVFVMAGEEQLDYVLTKEQ